MRVKELIEKLEDLATFLTLAQNDAGESAKTAKNMENPVGINYHEGKQAAYKTVFNKVDAIIKEVKR